MPKNQTNLPNHYHLSTSNYQLSTSNTQPLPLTLLIITSEHLLDQLTQPRLFGL
jgi:hypothetical protein